MPSNAKASTTQTTLAIAPATNGLDPERPAPNGFGPGRVFEIQRSRLLSAMIEECAARGAGNVSVAHIVSRAGVSRRTFYEIFTDGEDCFLAAFNESVARASRYILPSYDHDADWAERVRTALTGLLSFLDTEPTAGQLLLVGSLGAGPRALEQRHRLILQMITLIDEGRKESKVGNELPPLTAEGILGGVLSILHTRLIDHDPGQLMRLSAPLMSMIVLPYLGQAAAREELARPTPSPPLQPLSVGPDPLRELGIRLTYRTVRVLLAIAATPGASNRQAADASGVSDQGQISKLLTRLHGLGLIENTNPGSIRGAPNSWVLTTKGWEVQTALTRAT